MNAELDQLLQQMHVARTTLWAAVDTVGPDQPVNANWNARDFFAHLAGWEAAVFVALRAHLDRRPTPFGAFAGVDALNAQFVAARQSAPVEVVRLECDIYRFAIQQLIAKFDPDDLQRPIRFPWGDESLEEFLRGTIRHEQDHADELNQLRVEG